MSEAAGRRSSANFVDRTGQRYGKLVVISRAETKYLGGKARTYWLCRCDCGNTREVRVGDLTRRARPIRSCGCVPTSLKLEPGGYVRGRIRNEYRQNARKRGLCWDLTDEDFDRLTSQSCIYCGLAPDVARTIKRSTVTLNGIDRVDNVLGYTPDNSVPCCRICNRAKRDMPYDEFMAWIARLTEYNFFHPDVMPSKALRDARRIA